VLGRLFFRLKNAETGIWYDPYVAYFNEKKIIDQHWHWIGQELDRKEVFCVLEHTLQMM